MSEAHGVPAGGSGLSGDKETRGHPDSPKGQERDVLELTWSWGEVALGHSLERGGLGGSRLSLPLCLRHRHTHRHSSSESLTNTHLLEKQKKCFRTKFQSAR